MFLFSGAMSKKRKYQDGYVAFGFTFRREPDGTELPQCLLCTKVLSNGCMKPSKLQEYLKSVHPAHCDNPKEVFVTKRARFYNVGQLEAHGFVHPRLPVVEASFQVAYAIAKQKKAYTIGESLIKPCALSMVETVLGKDQITKLCICRT